MERISLEFDRKAIIQEHRHRYKLSSILSRGKVLDISCGIGYGSQIISEFLEVESCIGVDISKEDVDYANLNFKSDKTEFVTGDICKLDFPDNSFDTIVSLETLEHIADPKTALKELSRVLKSNGLFIGTVPEASYDEKCERIYGPNPYHLHKFSKNQLFEFLKTDFSEVEIVTVGFMIGSFIEGQRYDTSDIQYQKPEGSYFFLASKENLDLKNKMNRISGAFLPALSMVEYDEELTCPLREALKSQQELIDQKDKLILTTEKLVDSKDEIIASMKIAIDSRDEAINSMKIAIESRDEAIASMKIFIDSRDEAIKSMEKVLEKRWEIIQEYDAKLKLLEG